MKDRPCSTMRRPSWTRTIPSRRADQGRDCGAAETQRIAENAPRWPDVKLVTDSATIGSKLFSISKPQDPECTIRLCRDACFLGAAERAGNALYGARVYVELCRRLAHAHAVRQGRPDTLSQLVLHAWPAVGPRGRGLAPFFATEIKQPIMPAADAVRRPLCRSSI